MDPKLPGALLKMTARWMEYLDRDSRIWFLKSLKQLKPRMDVNYPLGRRDQGDRLPTNPFNLEG